MLQTTVYHSRFLKADRRPVVAVGGGSVSTTRFNGLAQVDDIYLPAGDTLKLHSGDLQGAQLLLPVAGEIILTTPERETTLSPGNLYLLSALELSSATLRNPFDEEAVNVILIQTNLSVKAGSLQGFPLSLVSKNTLVPAADCPVPVRVGIYDSRVKDSIALSAPGSISISYVINGAFEIEDRLLEYRDALLLWETSVIEFEALSEAAIILHLDLSGK